MNENEVHRPTLEAVRDALRKGGYWVKTVADELDALLSKPAPAPVEEGMPTLDLAALSREMVP